MAHEENNPFILPGFGQPGVLGQNPVLASMEMMRKAWENLAGSSGVESAMMQSLSPEDLDRRIGDLRAVENWLRMNLAMLSSTIQGLEVQRATVSTLRSFVASAGAAATPAGSQASGQPSPLEVVLGLRPGHKAAAPAAAAPKRPSPPPEAPAQAEPSADGAAPDAAENAFAGATAAAQGWWDMLQKQFDTLAAATSAGMQNAEALKQAATAAEAAPASAAGRKAPARKAASRKTAARKTAARKAAPARRKP